MTKLEMNLLSSNQNKMAKRCGIQLGSYLHKTGCVADLVGTSIGTGCKSGCQTELSEDMFLGNAIEIQWPDRESLNEGDSQMSDITNSDIDQDDTDDLDEYGVDDFDNWPIPPSEFGPALVCRCPVCGKKTLYVSAFGQSFCWACRKVGILEG